MVRSRISLKNQYVKQLRGESRNQVQGKLQQIFEEKHTTEENELCSACQKEVKTRNYLRLGYKNFLLNTEMCMKCTKRFKKLLKK